MNANAAVEEMVAEVQREPIAALVLESDDVPTRILVAPWGEVKSALGTFVVDSDSAAATIAAFAEHGTDVPIDYEHQSLGGAYASPTGQAPAAGWIKALRAVTPEQAAADADHPEPGLWADVEWTPVAAEQLRGRQYRYLSPVALVRRTDRRLIGLHSVALTNKPGIVGMRAVVNRDALPTREPPASGTGVMGLRLALGLDGAVGDEAVLVAATQRIRELERGAAQRAAEERVARACAAGKLTAAQRPWALTMALRDPAEFDAWERGAPIVIRAGRTEAPNGGHAPDRGRAAVEAAARAEWQANRAVLERLCTDEAFVADAVRMANSE